MNKYLILLLLVIPRVLWGSDPRVVYKEASEELNRQAIQALREKFSPSESWSEASSLFAEILICPAGLWDQIRSDDIFDEMNMGVMKSRVPLVKKSKVTAMIPREGKMFQSHAEIANFWTGFQNKIRVTGSLQIRKLTELERDVLWTMIAWSISEPIFICEWDNHQILVDMDSDLKICYIDELQDYIDGDYFEKKRK